jgi:hypothetical protein
MTAANSPYEYVTIWFAVGASVIFLGALGFLYAKRHLTELKAQRQAEDDEANELIVKNAERAGWGAPRPRHKDRS